MSSRTCEHCIHWKKERNVRTGLCMTDKSHHAEFGPFAYPIKEPGDTCGKWTSNLKSGPLETKGTPWSEEVV